MFENIPAELRALPQWVCWRHDKAPVNARTGELASTTDPMTWSTYEQATTAVDNKGINGNPVYGIGFVFAATDPYTGIDIDGKTATATELADQKRIVDAFDSYTELSPSGQGVHIIIRAKLQQSVSMAADNVAGSQEAGATTALPKGIRRSGVEIYSTGRYFRFTGNVLLDRPIQQRQGLLDTLAKQMRPKSVHSAMLATTPEIESDADILARMQRASNWPKIEALGCGDASSILSTDHSGSAIDQALVNLIQFYTKNPQQIERIWMMTPHAQSRAHKMRRADYKLATIQRSFDMTADISGVMAQAVAGSIALAAATPGNGNGALGAVVEPATVAADAAPAPIRKPRKRKSVNPYVPPAGLVGELAQWIYSQAPRPVAEIALAGALGWMAGVAGKAYNVSGEGLNLYIAMLASSGTGKEAVSRAYSKIEATLTSVGIEAIGTFMGPGDFASVPALAKCVRDQPSCVSIITEFGYWLSEMLGERANPQRASIRKTLLALYSKSGRGAEFRATNYSDKANTIEKVVAPSYSLIGDTTPSTFYNNITQKTIEDGFLPRFVIVEYTGPAPKINNDAFKVQLPIMLQARLAEFVLHCCGLNTAKPMPVGSTKMSDLVRDLVGPTDVVFGDDCAADIYAFSDYCTEQANDTDNEGIKNLWSRVWMNTVKIAAIAAVGVNAHNPLINTTDFQWAKSIVLHSMNLIVDKVESGEIASDNESKQWNDLLRCLAALPYYETGKITAYGLNDELRALGIVNTKWLGTKVSRLASFVNDRMGAGFALKRVVQRAEDEQLLIANPNVMHNLVGGGKLYRINTVLLAQYGISDL